MKKLLFIAICFITSISFAQTSPDTLTVAKVVEIPINTEGLEKSFTDILKPYLEKTLTGLEKGAEYAVEEIPIILQQYVMYEAVISWFLSITGLLFILIPIIFIARTFREKSNFDWNEESHAMPTIIISIFLFIAGMIMFCCNIETAILATWFPKLFIVKEFLNYM